MIYDENPRCNTCGGGMDLHENCPVCEGDCPGCWGVVCPGVECGCAA